MSEIPSYFTDFLHNIRLSDELTSELKKAHKDLRDRLASDDITKDLLVDSFIQGSYARSTCIKPEPGHKVDVDVIAVTNLDHETTSAKEAFEIIMPFAEKYYDHVRPQKRSIGIALDKVDVDLVITAAPSEEAKREIRSARLSESFTVENVTSASQLYHMDSADNSPNLKHFFNLDGEDRAWQKEPLLIPDSEADEWYRTHPLEQIRWTMLKNRACNGHYINVVKALKWWKRKAMPDNKHPKSYPLEHFIGDCCPDGITSVAEGIVKSLEKIVLCFPQKPVLADRGVPEHDVFESLSEEDYISFYDTVKKYAPIARKALEAPDISESVRLWREFFCGSEEFPTYRGGFSPRTQKTEAVPTGRFG